MKVDAHPAAAFDVPFRKCGSFVSRMIRCDSFLRNSEKPDRSPRWDWSAKSIDSASDYGGNAPKLNRVESLEAVLMMPSRHLARDSSCTMLTPRPAGSRGCGGINLWGLWGSL